MEVNQDTLMDDDRRTMEEIKNYLIPLLNGRYGYCGVAASDNFLLLNSGSANLTIKIEIKS